MNPTTQEPKQEDIKANGHGQPPVQMLVPARGITRKQLWLAGGGIALIALVIALVPVIRHALTHESTDDAFIDGHVISMAPKVSGQVTAVHVVDNQRVKAGDLLVEIDPRDNQAKVAEHRGKLAAAEAEARRAVADAKRYEKIFAQDEISRQQLDNARAAAASAVATVDRERGALEQEELNLSYTKITAPEDGRVTRKSVEAGSYVSIGQALLALVPETFWVTANFKETQLTHIRPGQQVDIKVDAYPNRKLEGRVESLQSGTGARFSLLPPENATGNYVKVVQRVPVKIVFTENSDLSGLAPGMSVVPSVNVQ